MEWHFYNFNELVKWVNNWEGFCKEYGIRYKLFASTKSGFRVVLDI